MYIALLVDQRALILFNNSCGWKGNKKAVSSYQVHFKEWHFSINLIKRSKKMSELIQSNKKVNLYWMVGCQKPSSTHMSLNVSLKTYELSLYVALILMGLKPKFESFMKTIY